MTATPIPTTTDMYQKVYTVPINDSDNSLILNNVTDNYITRIAYDASGREEYIGYAKPGSSSGDEVWQIRKLAYDGSGMPTSILFADGNNLMDNEWDNRAGYSYS